MFTMAHNSIMRNLLIIAELLLFDANLIRQSISIFHNRLGMLQMD